ncbi:DUF887-domain-containing protein [Hysterangium stoloniferum]|nr:DUF887-domain-containing protein [Hysterangium stoloniferum]
MSLDALLAPISIPIANALGLPRLPSHFSLILISFLSFHAIQQLSPIFFNRWFPQHYGTANRRVKRGWAVRACSMVHAVVVAVLASQCIALPELNNDKIFGTHPFEGQLEAFSTGAIIDSFLWDAMEECLIYPQDIGLALHGLFVLTGLLLTFRPLFAYTSVNFLLMEMSTPFVNMHWFFDKTGRTGTTLQLVNGLTLIVVFFGARICYGSLVAYRFLIFLYNSRAALPQLLALTYAVGTMSLQVLNWVWMYKMLAALRKRFPAAEKNVKKTQ